MRKADRRLGNQKPKQQNEGCVRIDGDDVVGGCREQAAIQSWLLSKLLPSPVRKGKRNQPMQALQNREPALTTIIGKGQPSGGEVPHLPLGARLAQSVCSFLISAPAGSTKHEPLADVVSDWI